MSTKIIGLFSLFVITNCVLATPDIDLQDEATKELQDEIAKYEAKHKLDSLEFLQNGTHKTYIANKHIKHLCGFTHFIIDMIIYASPEKKIELTNAAQRVILLKKEWEREHALLLHHAVHLNSIIEECKNTPGCPVFDQVHNNMSREMGKLCNDELVNRTESIYTGELYEKWMECRYRRSQHFNQ